MIIYLCSVNYSLSLSGAQPLFSSVRPVIRRIRRAGCGSWVVTQASVPLGGWLVRREIWALLLYKLLTYLYFFARRWYQHGQREGRFRTVDSRVVRVLSFGGSFS